MKNVLGRGILLTFIATGVLFRIVGLGWGIPLALPPHATTYRNSFHFDEDNYLWGLTRMKPQDWNFNVEDFHWGTLQFYLIAGALQVGYSAGYLRQPWRESFLSWDSTDFPRIYVTGRAVSTLGGIISLLVIFLVGRKLHSAEAGLAAAAFLAVSPLHVVNSHFLTSDVTMVLLLLAALYFFLSSLEHNNTGSYLSSGFLLGLAVAAKYNAAFMVFLWIGRDLIVRKAAWKPKILGYLAMVAGLAGGEPYAFVHAREFLGAVFRANFVKTDAVNLFLPPWPRLLFEQAWSLARIGLLWTVAIPAVFGMLLCVARPSRKRAALAAAIVLMAVSLLAAGWPMIRYTLPLVPLAILAATLFVLELPVRESWRPWIFALLASYPLFFSWAQMRILTGDHPANQASAWIQAHVPEGSRIGQIWPELPPLDSGRYNLRSMHGIFPHDRAEPPDLDREYLILDNLPIRPFAESFSKRLEREYVPLIEFRSDPGIGPLVLPEGNAPHDWKYTHPVIRIYRRK